MCAVLHTRFLPALALGAALNAAAADQNCSVRESYFANTEGVNQYFGHALAMHGETIYVGTGGDGVRILDTSGRTLGTLAPPGPLPYGFGTAIAIDPASGSIGAVGAPYDSGTSPLGTVFVFDLSTGAVLQALQSPQAHGFDLFGAALAMDSTTLVVGAPIGDCRPRAYGWVDVFEVPSGRALLHLTPAPPQNYDEFGSQVGVVDDLILVGAPARQNSTGWTGAVFVFDRFTGAPLRTLTPPAPGELFGDSIATSNGLAIVGYPASDERGPNAGAAYLVDPASGRILQTFFEPVTSANRFGSSVAIDGNRIAVATSPSTGVPTDTAVTYVFDARSGELIAMLDGTGDVQHDFFASALAMAGSIVVAGAPGDDTPILNAGSIFVFNVDCPSPCAADLTVDSTVDGADLAVLLGAWGACGACPADLDASGNVDAVDIAILLGAWGACI